MSLLRRLGEQAQQVKDAEAAQERSRQQRKDRYTELVVPAMQAISVFLSQLTDQLKVVRPTVLQSFELPGYGRFPTISLLDYTVRSEPRYSDFQIEVVWKSRVDSEKAPKLSLTSFDRIRNIADLFKRFHLGGFKDERKGPTGHVIACTVQATGFITSKLNIVGSLEDDQIRFVFDNVDQMLPTRQAIPVEVLSDEVCDRLGEFLLRENDTFIRDSWVRGLKVPVVPLKPVGYDTPAVKPLNAGPDEGKAPLPSAVITAPAFLGATMQKSDRDNALMAELSEAARLAEAAVLKTMVSGDAHAFGSERVLSPLKFEPEADSVAPAAEVVPVPAPERAAPAPVMAPPAVPPAPPPAPAVAAPVAPASPRAVPAPAPAPTAAAASPAPVAARPVVAPPASAPSKAPAAPVRPVAPAAVRPAPPPAAPPPKPVAMVAPPAAAAPAPAASPAPAEMPVANPAQPGQPAAARGFMDRFKKMRADLERE